MDAPPRKEHTLNPCFPRGPPNYDNKMTTMRQKYGALLVRPRPPKYKEAVEVLINEADMYRALVMCEFCRERIFDGTVTGCGHRLCKPCYLYEISNFFVSRASCYRRNADFGTPIDDMPHEAELCKGTYVRCAICYHRSKPNESSRWREDTKPRPSYTMEDKSCRDAAADVERLLKVVDDEEISYHNSKLDSEDRRRRQAANVVEIMDDDNDIGL